MNVLAKKVLNIMTNKGIIVAKDPYKEQYCIQFYPHKDTLSVEFYNHVDAVMAQQALAKEFDWFEIHELSSFKMPRYILVATLGSPHRGVTTVH